MIIMRKVIKEIDYLTAKELNWTKATKQEESKPQAVKQTST